MIRINMLAFRVPSFLWRGAVLWGWGLFRSAAIPFFLSRGDRHSGVPSFRLLGVPSFRCSGCLVPRLPCLPLPGVAGWSRFLSIPAVASLPRLPHIAPLRSGEGRKRRRHATRATPPKNKATQGK